MQATQPRKVIERCEVHGISQAAIELKAPYIRHLQQKRQIDMMPRSDEVIDTDVSAAVLTGVSNAFGKMLRIQHDMAIIDPHAIVIKRIEPDHYESLLRSVC